MKFKNFEHFSQQTCLFWMHVFLWNRKQLYFFFLILASLNNLTIRMAWFSQSLSSTPHGIDLRFRSLANVWHKLVFAPSLRLPWASIIPHGNNTTDPPRAQKKGKFICLSCFTRLSSGAHVVTSSLASCLSMRKLRGGRGRKSRHSIILFLPD